MTVSKPYEFRDEEEVIQRLSEEKVTLSKWFDRRVGSLEEVVRNCAGSETFRAFRHMAEPPSSVFRNWAVTELQNHKTELESIDSQSQFDEWVRKFCNGFCQEWYKRMRVTMPYGPGRKLPDLLLKQFVTLDGLKDDRRCDLLNFLHVPLDSFTLVGARNCLREPQIPKNATMGFVDSENVYMKIQQSIRGISHKAGVPPIYFDILAWNLGHPNV